jgi:hypothetical protein
MNLFIAMVLGHFVADYLLQTKEMALEKAHQTLRGWVWCLVHCTAYTITVAMFAGRVNLVFLSLVFASHFFIDHWSLADKWLSIIGGRTLRSAYESTDQMHEFDIVFTAIVYTVADNTMHLLLLWQIARLS